MCSTGKLLYMCLCKWLPIAIAETWLFLTATLIYFCTYIHTTYDKMMSIKPFPDVYVKRQMLYD